MGVEEIEAEIQAIQARIERNTARGDDANALEPLNIELQRAERRLAKEEAKLPVHPAYVSFLPTILLPSLLVTIDFWGSRIYIL